MIEKVFVNLIKRHIVTKLAICTRIARGQREEWTAGVVDSEEDNGRGQREVHEEWTARRTAGGASSYKFLKKKLYDFSPQLGPVESSYLLVQLKFVFLCVVY